MNPTDRELEILKVLWDIGEGSVRAVHEQMAASGEPHFNTVQTQLRTMDRKGLVAHRREGRTLIYRPLYSRDQESSRFLNQVFNGSLDQLVLSMLSAEPVEPETLDELEELIKEVRKKGHGKKRQGR
jgi:BlaI family transcriptional regulator, penicillinase repressor